jgi:hypothetical protein
VIAPLSLTRWNEVLAYISPSPFGLQIAGLMFRIIWKPMQAPEA